MISFAEVNEVARGHHHPNVGSVAEGTDPHSSSVCTNVLRAHTGFSSRSREASRMALG